MASVQAKSSEQGPFKCARCGAAGTVFYVSRFATPALSFVTCVLCAYRWVVPAAGGVRGKPRRAEKRTVKGGAARRA